MAAAVTGYVDTIDVAGLAFRLSCRYPKPRAWARSRPEFLTRRAPDVDVTITYDDDFRRRARLPAGQDTFPDAPRVRGVAGTLRLTTAYYRAMADLGRGRVTVRMASGFGVANLMRTLAALWLGERDALLLRGVRVGGDDAILACGLGPEVSGVTDGPAVAGDFAVTAGPSGVTARLTPFVEGGRPPRGPHEARLRTLWVPRGSSGRARVVGVVLPAIWQPDRRRAALVRTIERATRIVTALAHHEIDVAVRAPGEAAVG